MLLPASRPTTGHQELLQQRERRREDKWWQMGRIQAETGTSIGGGMQFVYDTTNAKLCERTWKGIPDRWRASAWHAFLTSSAQNSAHEWSSDRELRQAFMRLVEEASPDDVQIDLDVPRTINSHIMFRRRYRGGQRLLFRVLHAMSLYFPQTGYVQGMATLAATLLCYYDEQMAFLMLVRMWQLRGLEALYASGFAGLMTALDEFEAQWLRDDLVAQKLVSCFPNTIASGTTLELPFFLVSARAYCKVLNHSGARHFDAHTDNRPNWAFPLRPMALAGT